MWYTPRKRLLSAYACATLLALGGLDDSGLSGVYGQEWQVAAEADVAASATAPSEAAAAHGPHRGVVPFTPTATESTVATRFRLEPHTFPVAQQQPKIVGGRFAISRLTFPSPVKTPHEANNTVHCEYYCPVTPAQPPVPGVVVLHILGGDFALSRLVCTSLAAKGVAALFVKMPYYGPRRQAGVDVRMVSANPQQTVAGMTQAVVDIRRAVAWLLAQKEIDPKRIGICGISLGGITASLAATAEPRITHVCPVLAGGDVGKLVWESPEVRHVRDRWVRDGGTRESLVELLRDVDPVTHARGMHGRDILMINATHDELVPRACTESLWEAFGRPRIVWLDGGHYTVAWHILKALRLVVDFFQGADDGRSHVERLADPSRPVTGESE